MSHRRPEKTQKSKVPAPGRRRFLGGLFAGLSTPALASGARAADLLFSSTDLRGGLDAGLQDLVPGTHDDASENLQAAIHAAAAQGRVLSLPPGTITVSNLDLPDDLILEGVPGRTRLVYGGRGHLFTGNGVRSIILRGLTLDGANQRLGDHVNGLIHLTGVETVVLEDVAVAGSTRHGVGLDRCGGRIERCRLTGAREAGLFAVESTALEIDGNTVSDCRSGGILLHRWSEARDQSRISANRVLRIGSGAATTDRPANGIEIFRAGDVLVSDNTVSDCAGAGIRAQMADAVRIDGNLVIAASTGISVTGTQNENGGALLSGNYVRDIKSVPDNTDLPVGCGLFIDAHATATGNVVEGAPVWGAVLGSRAETPRINFSGNTLRRCARGVGVPDIHGPGQVLISGNLFDQIRDGAVFGMKDGESVTQDLTSTDASGFARLVIGENAVIS